MANVVVCARFRPPSRSERASGSAIVGGAVDSKTAQFKLAGGPSPPFVFDHVFDVGSTQEEVFQHSARHLVTEVFGGYNATIFAYGQTGSGKTHTMMGEVKTPQRGIIPRLVEAIFSGIEDAPPDIEFTVKLSYVEIYNEKIRDLLNPSSDDLKIREMTGKGVWIEGVTESYVGANEQVLEIMNQGATNRAIASTNMNLESSRSHSVFILTLGQRDTKTEGKKASKLILVDLAGSEKISKTGAEGKTLKEAQHINKSLAALGNVINALTSAGKKHVPYRDSKLTRLLSDSLGGNSKTTLLVTCSPCADNVEESLTTLRFGQRAKTIKNKPIVNAEKSVAEYVKLLAIAQTKINAQSQIIRLLEKDVLDLRNCVAGVDPKHLKTPMPAIRRHTLEEIMAGVKHEEEEKKEDEEGQDDDSEAADSKESSRSTSPTPLTAAAPAAAAAVPAVAAVAAAPGAPAATDKPARRIIKIAPVTSPSGATTPTTPSAGAPASSPPSLPRGMSIFMGPGGPGGPGLLGPHDSVIAESAALQERMEELKKERLEVADQLADKVRELEEQRQDMVRINEQLKELTARKEEAEVRAQGSDQLRTELNLLRAKLGTLEREQTLAANDWARQLQEAKQQLTAAKIAAAAIQAAPATAATSPAAAAGDAAAPAGAATPGPAPAKAPTGNITPDVVIEALRMSLKKKCDQFAELSQVQDSRRDQIVMLERALDEVKLKARTQETEVKTLRDELTSAKHMCKRLLESGLYWRQLRKTEMGQTGVVTLQGGGGAVVTMRGGSGAARALPGGATLHPMPGASGGGAAGGPPPASPASIARADPRMVTSPTGTGVGAGGAALPYAGSSSTPPLARGSLNAGSTPLRVHPNPNILGSPQPPSSSSGAASPAAPAPAASR